MGAARISGRAFWISAQRPRQARDQQCGRKEEPCIPIGHPHHRGALCLGLLDQPDEGGVCAFARGPICPEIERSAGVGRATQNRHPAPDGLRQRLAGERAGVEHGLRAEHGSVDRDDLAGPHQHDVAELHPFDFHLLETVVHPQLRKLRRALDERRQLAAGAPRGNRLERRSAREHQPDDHAGELLAQRQGAYHRHERDRVDAQTVLDDDGAANLHRELGCQQRDRPAPHRLAGGPLANRVKQTADHERGNGDRREDLRMVLNQPGQPGGTRMLPWFDPTASPRQGWCAHIAHPSRITSIAGSGIRIASVVRDGKLRTCHEADGAPSNAR
jgi:hypothetical protein